MRLILSICLVVILCGMGTGIILIVRGCDLTAPDYPKYEYGNISIRCKNIETAKSYAEKLAKFNKAMVKQFGDQLSLLKEARTINICIFPTRAEFDAYSFNTTHKEYVHNSGFYNPSRNEIVLEESIINLTQKTLYHELTHLLMELGNKGADYSRWFSEGIAMYFEESNIDDKGIVKLGGLSESAVKSIKENGAMPLHDLLKSSHSDFSSSRNSFYYNQSHVLVYFLFSKHRENFLNYYNEEAKAGHASTVDFEKHFGNIKEVEENLLQFIETWKPDKE